MPMLRRVFRARATGESPAWMISLHHSSVGPGGDETGASLELHGQAFADILEANAVLADRACPAQWC